MDQDCQRRFSVGDSKDESSSGKTLSAAARRSFFRRKLKHKRSGSRDGRDAPAADAISTDSVSYMEGEEIHSHSPCEQHHYTSVSVKLQVSPVTMPIPECIAVVSL